MTPGIFGTKWAVIDMATSPQAPGLSTASGTLTLYPLRVSECFLSPGTSWWPLGADVPKGGQ